jgi:hypothetical protein
MKEEMETKKPKPTYYRRGGKLHKVKRSIEIKRINGRLYQYLRWWEGGKRKSKYIGRCAEFQQPHERYSQRKPRKRKE